MMGAIFGIVCYCWQDDFIRRAQVLIRNKESVKYKVKAQWATEDKMRDTLKLKEPLACMWTQCGHTSLNPLVCRSPSVFVPSKAQNQGNQRVLRSPTRVRHALRLKPFLGNMCTDVLTCVALPRILCALSPDLQGRTSTSQRRSIG